MVEATLTPERVQQMFCFQCEQTARGTGCTGKQGVCGKSAEVAGLEDQLTGAMIALSQGIVAGAAATAASDRAVTRGLFTCITNVDFDPASVQAAIDHVHAVKTAIAPFDTTPDFDMDALWNEGDEDVRSLKSLVLFGIRGTAAYAYHAAALGRSSRKVFDFFYKALAAIGSDTAADDLLALVDEAGAVNLDCMAMLDEANTGTYGTPFPPSCRSPWRTAPSSLSPDMTSRISRSCWTRLTAPASTSTPTARCCPPTPTPSSSVTHS